MVFGQTLDKKTLLEIYKNRHPERWKEFLITSGETLTKGSEGDVDAGIK